MNRQKVQNNRLTLALFMLSVTIITIFVISKIPSKKQKLKYIKKEPTFIVQQGLPPPINTRPVDDYSIIGYLTNKETENMLPLYGRRTHRTSSLWNYFTRSDGNFSMLIPIYSDNRNCTKKYGCKELMDEQYINLKDYKGKYKVSLY